MLEQRAFATEHVFTRCLAALQEAGRLLLPQRAHYQEQLMEQSVRHAYANIAFFRDCLAYRIDATGKFDLVCWNEISVLQRSDSAPIGPECARFGFRKSTAKSSRAVRRGRPRGPCLDRNG